MSSVSFSAETNERPKRKGKRGQQTNWRMSLRLKDPELVKEDTRDRQLLHFAGTGEVENVRSLIEEGADPTWVNNLGQQALHWAAGHGHIDCVELLLKIANINPDPTTHKLWTPLHYASYNGHIAVVEVLLAHGANPMAQNSQGDTPSSVAKSPEIRELLNAKASTMPSTPPTTTTPATATEQPHHSNPSAPTSSSSTVSTPPVARKAEREAEQAKGESSTENGGDNTTAVAEEEGYSKKKELEWKKKEEEWDKKELIWKKEQMIWEAREEQWKETEKRLRREIADLQGKLAALGWDENGKDENDKKLRKKLSKKKKEEEKEAKKKLKQQKKKGES